MSWVKWKNHQGVKLMGSNKYNPPQPYGPWTKIMGVVARCEGNHDTVISYDGTGVTWGFMQWTFTSGRLQKLLQYLKTINYYHFEQEDSDIDMFSRYFRNEDGSQVFERFGFKIEKGKFVEVNTGKVLDPRKSRHKRKIDDICMGRAFYKTFKDQKIHATLLAKIFNNVGKESDIAFAQIEYAKREFKRSIQIKRKPLGEYKTLANLLDDTWDTYIPAVFFNLWQNSPAAAYKLFIKARDESDSIDKFKDRIWKRLKNTKFANWSYAKSTNKAPRIRRISKAVNEFYGIKLPVR